MTEIKAKCAGKFFMSVKADSIHEIMPDFSGDKTYTFKVYQDGQEYSVTGVRGEHDGDEIVFYKEGF